MPVDLLGGCKGPFDRSESEALVQLVIQRITRVVVGNKLEVPDACIGCNSCKDQRRADSEIAQPEPAVNILAEFPGALV